jgi:hypothetical protein
MSIKEELAQRKVNCPKGIKKGQAYCIAPLQLYALASIKTWGIKRSWSYRAHPNAKVTLF